VACANVPEWIALSLLEIDQARLLVPRCAWRALYTGIDQFANDLIAHIHLENNQLFPQFEPQRAACC